VVVAGGSVKNGTLVLHCRQNGRFPDTTARTVPARRYGCPKGPEREAGPTSGRMIFHHATADNMSFAARLVMVI